MARNFTRASSQYLTVASCPLAAYYPCTLACWYNTTATGLDQVLISVGTTANDVNRHNLSLASVGNVVAAFSSSATTSASAPSAASFSAGIWQHAAGVFTAANSRASFLNGASKGTDATSISPAGLDVTRVGIRAGATPGTGYMSGLIADAACWNVALNDDEVLALARGLATPLDIRRSALVGYWPLIGYSSPETDRIGGRDLTLVNGPTRGDHPPIALHSARHRVAVFLPVPVAARRPVGRGLIGSPLVRGGPR